MSQLCRICLFVIPPSPIANSVNVYLRTADSVAIIDVMKECTSIEVMDPDDLPKYICTSCVTKLNFVYEFRNLIISSDIRLKMQLQYYRTYPQGDNSNEYPNLSTTEIQIKEETEEIHDENPIETFIPPEETTTQSEILEDKCANTETVACEDDYKCRECGKTFSIWNSFKRHEMEHTGFIPYSCKYCNKGFYTKWTLTMHIRSHNKQYSCDECEKKFRTPDKLNVHKRIHRGLKPYQCDICNKSFDESTRLNIHMRIHTGEKPFMCEKCGKTFRERSSLDVHLRGHEGKKLLCPICGKSTPETGLRSHIKSHTGEKPHVCDECGRAFTVASSLKTHKNAIHFGIKAHKCNVCKKSFSQSCTLVKHMLTHSGEKPFPCTLCPKEFAYKHHLQSHVDKHHGGAREMTLNREDPVECENVCSK